MSESVESHEWRSDLTEWTVHHFSVSHKGNDVPTLMETVASQLRQLDAIDVLDLTFSRSFEHNSENLTISVYLNFIDQAPEVVSGPVEQMPQTIRST